MTTMRPPSPTSRREVLALAACVALGLIWVGHGTWAEQSTTLRVVDELDTVNKAKDNTPTNIEPPPSPIIPESLPNGIVTPRCGWSKTDPSPGRRNSKTPVQIVHIPKAGGTALQDLLRQWAWSQSIPIHFQDGGGPFWEMNENPASVTGLLLGHRGYGFAPGINTPFSIVAVREPLSRVVSLFDYLRDTTDTLPYLLQKVSRMWKRMTLDEAVASYNTTFSTNPSSLNPGGSASISDRTLHRILTSQTEFMCGYDCVKLITDDPRETHATYLSSPAIALTAKTRLDRALRNLDSVDAIAPLTHLDDLIPQMQARLNWIPRDARRFPHENVASASRKSVPSKSTIEILTQFSHEDLTLYRRAVEVYEERKRDAEECLRLSRAG